MGHDPYLKNQETNYLVLSSDAKPRLKWTPELHRRFVDSVTQLGGADKATPKSLKRVMGIPGLTLYHLKSHLQKYRLGKSQQKDTFHETKQEEYKGNQRGDEQFSEEVGKETQNQTNGFRIAQALKMQMEVQRELHEQIEVQRHLQLRIEAQGKYLQSVLNEAQKTLSGNNSSSSSVRVELAKSELSRLASMVDNGWPSYSLSVSREKDPMDSIGCSLESSLTSSESEQTKKGKQSKCDNSVVLSLMDLHSLRSEKGASSNQENGRKKSGSTICDGKCSEQACGKGKPTLTERGGDQLRKFGLVETFDLNCQYM